MAAQPPPQYPNQPGQYPSQPPYPGQPGQGQQPLPPGYRMVPPPPPGGGGMSGGIIALIVVGAILIIIGPMALLAISGMRRYVANSKMVEARNSLGEIGRDAAREYEDEKMPAVISPGQAVTPERRLCASASRSVPASATSIQGRKYQSAPSEWQADEADDAGFYCLKFSLDAPQYYMYSYEATKTSFTAKANGDLNGDGVLSTFTLGGRVDASGALQVDPVVHEINPLE